MKRARKVLLGILTFLLVSGLILAIAAFWFVRRPWPEVSGTLAVSGLSAPVKIVRDKWGVPHIYAQNEADLFFAQGYVHAQDRLWQMEFNRRIGSGTLSEVLGDVTVDIDRFTRTVGMRRAAEKDWAVLDEETRALLEVYAAGVNAYVATHQDRLPLEFTILGVPPTHWTPIDTLTLGKLMGWQLAGDYGLDLLRATIIARRGEKDTEQILPFSANGVFVPPEVQDYAWLKSARLEGLPRLADLFGQPTLFEGSNSWVIHGSRSASGKPMLAIDTHLSLNMPSIWYENGLQGGRFHSVGFTLPGAPLVLTGHNQRIAWGGTNLSTDLQDLYLEKFDDPVNPTQYEFMGEWRDLQVVTETISVKDQTPVTLTVRYTHHGPVVNSILEGLEDSDPITLQWPDLQGSTLIKSIIRLNLASNWEEFRDALRYWEAPKQNYVYADVDGNIGYQAVGKVPIRTSKTQGVLPVPGWTGTYEWQGFIPFEEMPTLYNPSSGFAVAANSRVVPPDPSPYMLEYFGVASYRAQHIAEVLGAKEQLTLEDFQTLQGDTSSLPAGKLRLYLLAIQPEDALQVQAVDSVKAWDLKYELDRVGASVYEVWHRFLERNLIKDELGEDVVSEYQRYGLATSERLIALMEQPTNAWFDDVNTPEVETRDDIVRRSLADAVAWLRERYGDDPAQWQWGRLHTMTFIHQPLGESGIAPVEMVFNSGPVPARGSDFTINNGWFSNINPYVMEGGVSQRFVIDLSDIENSLAILATGQSGHAFHPHRDDMIAMWQNLEYHPLLFSQAEAEAQAEAVLTLTPQ